MGGDTAAARADPHVTGYRYRPIRVLEGDRPVRCSNGHCLDGGSANRAGLDHRDCGCGGHLLLACRWEGCTAVTIDPPPTPDCDPPLR